ncbi:uncharacterized protein LOC143100111 isoform X2 [Alosa pseudoharengus]|uniref:uncharacterized protein LOC143100111 isoform X2 n=1 Tax=Alosa pseudoharengus TaxID=34774 RepID=UPI003F886FC4
MFLFEGSSATAKWIYLGLLIYIPFSKGSDVDTLEVQYTVNHGPGGKLQFQQTTLFNGHVIFACSSPTLRDQPRQHWVTQAFTQEELEERHQQCKSQCYEHFAWFEKIQETITVSAGVELHIFGEPILGRTVSYLQCHVTGISLSGISIQLTKDGVPLDHGVHQIGPRPNGDGTVQMRVQVKTTVDNSKTYRCEVHSETFNKSVLFDDPSPHQSTVIGTVVQVIVTVICSMTFLGINIGCHVLVKVRKERKERKTAAPEAEAAIIMSPKL